ncbi:hypothetical protein [Pseudoduganella buxea]|uniref:hypothetical protein n=1 Tax=Pseudoduganella buxea TaxID=1949069 RepID=UPI00166A94BD|nr:hypothetical protein [Pseudoduganella buxea]
MNGACGKAFPRQVNFCPYCGTSQVAGVRPAPAAPAARAPAPPLAAAEPPVAVAPPARESVRPQPTQPPRPPAPSPAAPPVVPPVVPPAAARPASPPAPRPAPTAAGPTPAQPPLRKPVGKVTWALVALFLLAVWFLVKPGDPSKKFDGRVDEAVALTKQCRIADARAELAELRSSKASRDQLARLQGAITSAATACERKQQRTRAWADTQKALETALASGAVDKASSRLATFTRKWSEDDETREWRSRIDARRAEKLLDEANACLARKDRACVQAKLEAAAKLKRPEASPRIEALRESLSRLLESTLLEGGAAAQPPAAPPAQPARQLSTANFVEPNAREAGRLQLEAERELAQGNYRGAMSKAAQCATLVAGGGRECQLLRDRAARLDREYQQCLVGGHQWSGERCQQ